jgi:hypothetical protein
METTEIIIIGGLAVAAIYFVNRMTKANPENVALRQENQTERVESRTERVNIIQENRTQRWEDTLSWLGGLGVPNNRNVEQKGYTPVTITPTASWNSPSVYGSLSQRGKDLIAHGSAYIQAQGKYYDNLGQGISYAPQTTKAATTTKSPYNIKNPYAGL